MEKIKKKIAALMAKAESTTNLFEAEVFLNKAYELMNKHQIHSYETNVDDLVKEAVVMEGKSGIPAWKRNLFTAVAKLYGAEIVRTRYGFREEVLRLVGKESACMTVEVMYPFILKQVKQQAKNLRDDGLGELQKLTIRVAHSTAGRIWEIIKAREAASVPAATGRGLVVKDEVDAYFAKKFPDIKPMRKSTVSVSAATEAAAKNISLNLQAEKQTAGQLLIGGG